MRLLLRVLSRLKNDVMYTDLEVNERCVPLYYHNPQSMLLFNYITKHFVMQEELDVIVLLPHFVLLVLPKLLILCSMEKYWDILWLVIEWV